VRRSTALYLALAGAISILAPAAQGGVSIKGIDTGGYPDVRVSVVTSQHSSSAPTLTENGLRVSLVSAENLGRAKSVVLALDRSRSMRGKALADALAAARAFVRAKAPSDRIAIVGFGSRAVQLTRFSSTTTDAVGALRTMAVDSQEGTALYDAVVASARALAVEPLPGRVIIVLTDGRDVSSQASLEAAIAESKNSGASVYAIAIESPQFSPEPLRKLAKETSGAYHGAASSAALGREYSAIAGELRRTWRLEYATTARPGEDATLRAVANGSSSQPATISLPSSLGPGAADPKPSRLLPDVFYRTVLGTQVMALVSFFIVLLAATLAMTTVKGARLRKRLAPHLITTSDIRKRKQEKERFAAAAGLFRATEGALEHWKFWQRLERLLERSDLPLRTVELVYLIAGAALLGATFGTLSGQSALVTFAMRLGSGFLPIGVVWFHASRRLEAFGH